MCSLLLVCAGLRTLHTVERLLNEEECRSVGKAGDCWKDELAIAIAVKLPSMVQKILDVWKGLFILAVNPIKSEFMTACLSMYVC